jgi:nucleolin
MNPGELENHDKEGDFQMNISNTDDLSGAQPVKKARKKERWSEERKAAAKADRDIEESRREADEDNTGETGSKKKKEKKKKKREEDLKVRKLSAEERISGPGNASEAETLRNALGFKPDDMQQKSIPGFEFSFDANKHGSNRDEDVNGSTDGKGLRNETSSFPTEKTGQEFDSDQQAEQNHPQRVDSFPRLVVEETVDGYVPRRIFVGGMPFGYTENMIREYWEYCGPIETLDMMTFPDTGRFKGIAFITFATEEAFESALACDGTDCDGQILKVQKCKADKKKRITKHQQTPQQNHNSIDADPREDIDGTQQADMQKPRQTTRPSAQKVQGYNVAYVGNIAFAATSDDIKALFEPFGATLVRLHTDKDTGKPKGYAHVHFKDEESLDTAVTMDGTPLLGRRIRVGFAQKKKNDL